MWEEGEFHNNMMNHHANNQYWESQRRAEVNKSQSYSDDYSSNSTQNYNRGSASKPKDDGFIRYTFTAPSGEEGSFILSVIFAALVCICIIKFTGVFIGGFLGFLIKFFIVLPIAASLGFLAWRNKMKILKIVLTVIAVIGITISIFGKYLSSSVMLKRLPNFITMLSKPSLSNSTATATVTITADSLNLRSEASMSSNVIKILKKGDTLTVTGNAEKGWLPVIHNGDNGFVNVAYVE